MDDHNDVHNEEVKLNSYLSANVEYLTKALNTLRTIYTDSSIDKKIYFGKN